MPDTFTAVHRIEFADTDAAGMAHFTVFFRLMEETEHAFYRSLGTTAFEETPEGIRGMPRVSAACDFHRALRFGQEVEVHLAVRKRTERSISYDFEFRARPGLEVTATGRMTVVHARSTGRGALSAESLPAELAALESPADG